MAGHGRLPRRDGSRASISVHRRSSCCPRSASRSPSRSTWSRFGTRLIEGLPLAALVGLQSFRFPLELLMHRAYVEGVMPVQMSYSGRNFDILAGLTAIPVAWALHRGIGGRRLALTWNILGAVLLVNIIAVAAAATPLIAAFGPDNLNTFVAYPPFVWLPAVLVLTAVTGHLLITRALYN